MPLKNQLKRGEEEVVEPITEAVEETLETVEEEVVEPTEEDKE